MSPRTRSRTDLRRPGLTIVGALAVFLATLAVTPLVGAVHVDLAAAFAGLSPHREVLFTLRLPRVLLAAVAGGSLAAAGLVFQTILRNDLATPFTLGVASGASLGAVVAFHLGVEALAFGLTPVPLFAFGGAMSVVALILAMVRFRGRAMDTTTLLLAGVTISLLCGALILLLEYMSDFTATQRMIFWMMGGLDTVGYEPVVQASLISAVGLAWIITRIPVMDQLLAGDMIAASRGVAVRRERLLLLVAAALVTGAVIAFTGPIGFVGLIVPHAVRRMAGASHVVVLPASILGGAALLPACDALARTIIAPAEIPVGVLTALIGAPFFLLILLRR